MKHFLALAVVASTAFAALAAAHTPNPNGNCDNVGDETLVLEGTPLAVGGGDLGAAVYVAPDMTVWAETNAAPGLQTHAHTCRSGGEYVTIAADSLLVG